jgi:hypothetical protein
MINLVFIAILIAIFQTIQTQDVATCTACLNTEQGLKTLCHSDGNLYSSSGCASCISSDIYVLISLGIADLAQRKSVCQANKQLNDCNNIASQSINTSYDKFCFSNGKLFTNIDKAKCTANQGEIVFYCKEFSNFKYTSECSTKCFLYSFCQTKYPENANEQKVCAKDGLIYGNVDQIKCINADLVPYNLDGSVDFGDVSSSQACKDDAKLKYGELVGVSVPSNKS